MSTVLVVDDKEMMRDSVAATLMRKNHTVVTAASGAAALKKIGQKSYDVVITDLQMPQMDGLELLAQIRTLDETLPVVFMTAYGTVETAVAAMKQGAYDYITKPFTGDELLVAVQRAVQHSRLVKENEILRAATGQGGTTSTGRRHTLIGSSPVMQRLKEQLARFAESHGTVLITGESGSGKEVAARWIHEHSPRRERPFLAINCAALSTSLLESELFGHERGAFTGAERLRKGRFELADGGTLLLDEISEIDPGIQAKLLRVLQEQTYERVGSSASRTVDVRIIATSNRDLPGEVACGGFREDLFFRLNVLPVRMPALREHATDVAELVEDFLAQIAAREGRAARTVEPEAMELLTRYRWPGNVRELQNICERAAVLTPGPSIDAALIAGWLQAGDAPRSVPASPAAGVEIEVRGQASTNADVAGIVCDGHVTLDDIERESIVATLRQMKGHRQKSAQALGIGVRTLGLKLKKWKEQKLVSESL